MSSQAIQRKSAAPKPGVRPVPTLQPQSSQVRLIDPTRAAISLVSVDPAAAGDLAARLSARHFETSPAEVMGAPRGSRRVSRARHVAIYLAHVTLGLPLRAVASTFGRDRSTAAYACRLVEDLRERPAFDAAVATLEIAAKALAGQEDA